MRLADAANGHLAPYIALRWSGLQTGLRGRKTQPAPNVPIAVLCKTADGAAASSTIGPINCCSAQ